MRIHGMARLILPVLMVLVLWGAAPHAHALEAHPVEVTANTDHGLPDQGGKASPCGAHGAVCHPASLPPPGFTAGAPLSVVRIGPVGADVIRLGRADDTPQRPPRLLVTA